MTEAPREANSFEDSFAQVYQTLLEKDVDTITQAVVEYIDSSPHPRTPFTIYRDIGCILYSCEGDPFVICVPSANLYRACCNLLIYIRQENYVFDKFARMSLEELVRFLVRCALLSLAGEQFEKAVRELVKQKELPPPG